jgi:hypothetical protein
MRDLQRRDTFKEMRLLGRLQSILFVSHGKQPPLTTAHFIVKKNENGDDIDNNDSSLYPYNKNNND